MAIPKIYLEKRKGESGSTITKDVPLLLFYSFSGKRLQYYTGQRIDSKYYVKDYWKSGKDPVKAAAPDATNINNILSMLLSDVKKLHTQAIANGVAPTVDYFRSELDKIYKSAPENSTTKTPHDFLSFFQHVIDGRESGFRTIMTGKSKGQRYKLESLKNAKAVLAKVKEFSKGKPLPFDKINLEFHSKYREFLFDQDKEISTFGAHVKVIKNIMNESILDGVNTHKGHLHPGFIKPSYEADTIALSADQLAKLEEVDLSAYPYLDNARDLFLVGCYSGQRYSDFSNLKIEAIENNFIRVRQIKTGERVTIPVMAKMAALMEKYEGSLPRSISAPKLNLYIKEAAKLAGLTQSVTVKNSRGGLDGSSTAELYKLITSHTARRTYATLMFKSGVPSLLIMAVTGHKTEASFLTYIRATNEDKAKMMAEMMGRLGI